VSQKNEIPRQAPHQHTNPWSLSAKNSLIGCWSHSAISPRMSLLNPDLEPFRT